ncbi:heme-degrading domain-containing protein [Youxingia wuxianensis]|uniref:Heme-degrading domain-containing protein n=1 Tax=Youxingia wuxianensis TaxID=2763678 RepID=A0A926EQZ0_9FIRM|nr:heme-degrading domain-containing protein [Youxingia wuxianensis]MBC8586116.1 heme-degrading domain-containing protein [Youxingia wuxianensis]
MENNTIKQQLEHVIREEEELVFDSFTAKDAFAIGGALIARAEKEGKKITVGISLYRRNVFYASMDGCTPDNDSWLRKKENTVNHFYKSSHRVALEAKAGGYDLYEEFQLSRQDVVPAGGAFPIKINGMGIVGVIALSGMQSHEDHGYVADAIREYTKK